jgi:hypothetical protein
VTSTYAASTDVPADRSRAEIERAVRRYGGRRFMYGWEEDGPDPRAVVAFVIHDRQVRFVLPMPDRDDPAFRYTPARRQRRSDTAREEAYEQAIRSRWRSLGLVIRAKLEAVSAGIVTFEDEFLAHLVLPEGDTVGDRLHPVIARTFAEGRTPPELLPPPRLALPPAGNPTDTARVVDGPDRLGKDHNA